MGAEKGKGKKSPKKKSAKGAGKKAVRKKAGLGERELRALMEKRKRPKWVPAEVWASGFGPPQGIGHIDRFYYSNCSEDVMVLNVMGWVIPTPPGAAVPLGCGSVPPLASSFVNTPPDLETTQVILSALADDGGVLYQYDYLCQIPPGTGALINSIVVGNCQFLVQGNWVTRLFGQIYGSLGVDYPLAAADMTITQL